jgi:phosphate starvation-inducible protein PhoH/intein/homing endonuclease
MARKRTRQELDEFSFEESYNKTQLLKVKPFKAKTESQAEAYRILKENTLTFLGGSAGCHARGAKIVMLDGTFKNVEDVCVGDLLMGPDSTPREVKQLIRGKDQMYKITPSKGESFVVNSEHILYLATRNKNIKEFKNKKYLEISVKELINGTKYLNDSVMIVNSSGIEFSEKELIIPPYILGIWLGDGTSSGPSLTCQDNSIYDEWKKWGELNELHLRETSKPNANCKTVHLVSKESRKIGNKMKSLLQEIGVLNNKHVPQIYKSASRTQRLELLAGLIDTDGHLTCNCYEYVTKSETLAIDVQEISRSLGLAAYIKPTKKKSQHGTEGMYYRIFISGNINMIPVKLEYKKANERKQIKNALHRSIKIEPCGFDDYYGFTLDKDHLYLTSDYVIHHNCGKTIIACHLALDLLSKGAIKKIFVTRPNIEAGKSLGYLPGGVEEKMFNYLVPIYDNMELFIGKEKLTELLDKDIIQCVPIGFLRGRTLADAFVIIDEAQNMTKEQLRMTLTRIGFGTNAVVTYDMEQIDIRKDESCVIDIPIFTGYNSIGHFEFSPSDVVRSEIVKTVLRAYMERLSNEEGLH